MSLTRLPLLRATIPKVLLSDAFNRADSALTLGNAETGQAWTATAGTWGVSSSQAYSSTDANEDRAILTVGVLNMRVSCSLSGSHDGVNSRQPALMARYVDANNFLTLIQGPAQLRLFKCEGGVFTSIANVARTPADGVAYRAELVLVNDRVDALINGALQFSYALSAAEMTVFGASTTIGLRLAKTGAPAVNARFDTLMVTTP